MIAPVTALSLLSMDPSPAVVQQAQNAAGTRHGLVNFTRLVRSLDKQRLEAGPGASWLEVQKTWETVLYARALLYALREVNEQSSTTASSLDELDKVLSGVETHVQAAAKRTVAPAPAVGLPLIELPLAAPASAPNTAAPALLDETVPAMRLELDSTDAALPADLMPDISSPPAPVSPAAIITPTSPLTGVSFNPSGYFARRIKEDAQGGEAGLLPLKTTLLTKTEGDSVLDQDGMRQRLMGGSKSGIGSSQLHEELGGQLADMSHRLKLNAMHFATALEEEKALLESSQDVLEKNLSSTKDSKGHLSTVSKKSRGTTCMTISIVVFVLLVFIWTYMLIKFT